MRNEQQFYRTSVTSFVEGGHGGIILKELSHGILSYFEHRQNYCSIEGNLKIILYKDGKIPKRL